MSSFLHQKLYVKILRISTDRHLNAYVIRCYYDIYCSLGRSNISVLKILLRHSNIHLILNTKLLQTANTGKTTNWDQSLSRHHHCNQYIGNSRRHWNLGALLISKCSSLSVTDTILFHHYPPSAGQPAVPSIFAFHNIVNVIFDCDYTKHTKHTR